MKVFIAILLLVFSATSLAEKLDIPKDVKMFVDQREQCDHFRGEEPYDAERQQVLLAQQKKYCAGTDNTLRGLKIRYKRNSKITKMLDNYEENIEVR